MIFLNFPLGVPYSDLGRLHRHNLCLTLPEWMELKPNQLWLHFGKSTNFKVFGVFMGLPLSDTKPNLDWLPNSKFTSQASLK